MLSVATCTLGVRKGRKKEAAKERSLFAARSIKVLYCKNVDLLLLHHLNRAGIDAALV